MLHLKVYIGILKRKGFIYSYKSSVAFFTASVLTVQVKKKSFDAVASYSVCLYNS